MCTSADWVLSNMQISTGRRGCWRGWWVSGGGGCVGGTRGSCFNDVLAIPVAATDSVTVPDRVLCDLQTETGRHGECT